MIRPVKNESGRNTAGEHALITITDSTGGDMFMLDDLSQMQRHVRPIDRELRTQYLLGVLSASACRRRQATGTSRLTVNGGYTVRYRKEYFTPAAAN